MTLRLAAPASKSVTNRALLCAALAEGTSHLAGAAGSDDAEAMAAALGQLGAAVDLGRTAVGGWAVTGTGGRPASPTGALDARLSGTTMRFLAAAAVLTPAGATVTGQPPLLRRPVGPLVAALRALGAEIGDHGGLPPVTAAGGGLEGGRATVDAAASSQFASAVLLVAPYARRPVALAAERLGAGGYVELTAALMRDFGAGIEPAGPAAWRVEAGRPYQAADLEVEYDASAAAHLFAVAAATGGQVTVTNATPGTLQPDAALPDLLAAMGATVTRDGDALTVRGPEALDPVDADLAALPDQVTTVAALAALAVGRSRLRGVAVSRGHETDRLAALATELAKLGVAVSELPDGLVVAGAGPGRLRPARLATWGDHRMAMALAAVATRVPGVVLEDPSCVAKTYPRFWDDLAAGGLTWRAHPGRVQ
ncbi:MAG TPA: 3-phosphoshikimate 1-carboxyvinyltransferase [Actinomycetota bacterium]|nr:3-phosphoshikimate 1-carboxyvinyltransferase [Actinomycetota bacterium]